MMTLMQPSILAPLALQSATVLHTTLMHPPLTARFSTSTTFPPDMTKIAKLPAHTLQVAPVVRFSTNTPQKDIRKEIEERLAKLEQAYPSSVSRTSESNENTNTSMTNILTRLKALETIKKADIPKSNETNYIKIGDVIFNKNKILSAQVRPSFFYLTYPYIMELTYQKAHTDFFVGGQNVQIPITYETTQYKFKYKNKESAEEDYKRVLENSPFLNR